VITNSVGFLIRTRNRTGLTHLSGQEGGEKVGEERGSLNEVKKKSEVQDKITIPKVVILGPKTPYGGKNFTGKFVKKEDQHCDSVVAPDRLPAFASRGTRGEKRYFSTTPNQQSVGHGKSNLGLKQCARMGSSEGGKRTHGSTQNDKKGCRLQHLLSP